MRDDPGVIPVLPPQEPTWNEACDSIDAQYAADPSFSAQSWWETGRWDEGDPAYD